MLSKQKLDIIKIIDLLGQCSANDIKVTYEKDGNIITNVHSQLLRLIESGMVKKVSGNYLLTDKCKTVLHHNKPEDYIMTIFSEEDIAKFNKFAAKDDVINCVTNAFCPHIYGCHNVKLSVLLSIISLNDYNSSKNRVNVLLKGEPGTGKSELIKWAKDNLWGFFADSNTSKTGFRGGAMGYQYKRGLLQKSDNSILLIDEIDKLDPNNLDALLSALSYGSVSINLDKVQKQTDAKVRCVAVCNNELKLKDELINRFDLVLELKSLNDNNIEQIINKKSNEWNIDNEDVSDEFFKKYVKYVNQYPTKLPDDREELSKLLMQEYKNGCLRGKSVRKIESIFRLSLALARLKLKQIADIQDVKQVLELIKISLY